MAKSEEFKNQIEKVKTDNQIKLEKYQQFMSAVLTGNKLEQQKLQAEIQPEQMNISSMFQEATLLQKTLMQVQEMQKLGFEIAKFNEQFRLSQARLGLSAQRNAILGEYMGSGSSRNLASKISYLSSTLARMKKLNALYGGTYTREINKIQQELNEALGLKNVIKRNKKLTVVPNAPVAPSAPTQNSNLGINPNGQNGGILNNAIKWFEGII